MRLKHFTHPTIANVTLTDGDDSEAWLLSVAKWTEVKVQPGSYGVMLSVRWKDKHRRRGVFSRTDHLLPTPSIPDLPASSLPWTLPQPSVFDHEFRLFPPGYAPARLCGYTAHHWTCLPAR
ncbi:unnamed protein product [Pleuronectes platessa]|uniref:Uncharacterized protein n=1 Tax=Pleuronectes platessa TaxID=8262 RepID=A0A9N7VHX0_PLEPL|nr:unnamed protein product [Pleuronectes platessa]